MTKVRVYLHNETDQTLVLAGVEDHDGDWLGGGAVQAIAPGTVAMTGTKALIGAIAGYEVDGTECRLRYQGEHDAGTTFMVHWNSPAIGAKPSVTINGIHVSKPQFHTNADEGHYSFWRAEGRADAVVHFFFRDAGEVWTDFRPQNDGFNFSNSGWADAPYTLPVLEGTPLAFTVGNANTGLCGGMVYAALDYFLGQQRVPQNPMNPPDTDPLFLYLVARLFDSFDFLSVTLLYSLMAAAADGDDELGEFVELPCRARVMAHEEWPQIMADIDAGRPSPITLQTVKTLLPTGLGECHQVLVYGYEAHGHSVTLRVYDPNQPGDPDVYMSFEDGDISQRIVVDHNVGVTTDTGEKAPIYCFIRMNYNREPVRIPTERRLTTNQIATRHLSMIWSDPEIGPETDEATGVRDYDIWPDCGTQRLGYTVKRRAMSWGVTFTAFGFYEPVVDFLVGTSSVEVQGLTDYTWAGQTVWQPGAPTEGELGLGYEETRDIHFRANGSMQDTFHGGIGFFFRAEDGNFTVPVVAVCREADDDPTAAWRRTFSLDVDGWREDVPGLLEARRDCFKRYLDAHREGLHPAADAAAEIELTLPGRRANPLLDPDPDLVGVVSAVQEQDPKVLATEQAFSSLPELKADLITQVGERIQELAAHPDVGVVHRPGDGIDVVSEIEDVLSGTEIQRPT